MLQPEIRKMLQQEANAIDSNEANIPRIDESAERAFLDDSLESQDDNVIEEMLQHSLPSDPYMLITHSNTTALDFGVNRASSILSDFSAMSLASDRLSSIRFSGLSETDFQSDSSPDSVLIFDLKETKPKISRDVPTVVRGS